MLIHVEEASSPVITSKGDVLEIVLLGEDTIKEVDLITQLYWAAEAIIANEDIATGQQKKDYETRMQDFVDWLVLHRRTQITATLRKKV